MTILLPQLSRAQVLFISTFLCLALSSCNDPLSNKLVPSPTLAPEHVVQIQLEALQNNDTKDKGIVVAFRFASPENKRLTGPLERFAQMVKGEPYRALLNHEKVTYGPVEPIADGVQQRIILHTKNGIYQFVFQLSRREVEPCLGCWLTDSVLVENFKPVQI